MGTGLILPSGSGSSSAPAWVGSREGSSPARVPRRLVSPALIDVAPDSPAQLATAFALARVGSPCPPSWSGAAAGRGGPGVDGSGLTAAAYAAAGITLPATAAIQYDRGPRVRAGTELLAGDLVFYGTPSAVRHTGIYIGDGTMIHTTAPDQLVQRTTYRSPGDDYLAPSVPPPPAAHPRAHEAHPRAHATRPRVPAAHPRAGCLLWPSGSFPRRSRPPSLHTRRSGSSPHRHRRRHRHLRWSRLSLRARQRCRLPPHPHPRSVLSDHQRRVRAPPRSAR